MKHTVFTTPVKKILKGLKRKGPAVLVFEEWANEVYANACKKGRDNCLLLAEIYSNFLWRHRKIDHYFLDAGMAEFLTSSVRDIKNDYCKAFPECLKVTLPPASSKWAKSGLVCYDDNTLPGAFVINFPQSEKRRSLMVIPDFMVRTGGMSYYIYRFAIVDGVDVMIESINSLGSANYDHGQEETLKLVMGLSLYLDAFPDYCREIKGNFAGIKETGGNKIRVSANSDADQFNRTGSSPHWRRGHFRILSSEKFRKKQGMTIFIKGAFIKGRAFHLTAND